MPNPDRERLKSLKIEFEKEQADLESVFKQAETTIGDGGKDSGRAWVGRTADNWRGDVRGRRGHVKRLLGRTLDEMQRKIDAMPEKVTVQEAAAMNKWHTLR
ncbi:hypothetical protein [Streptomyces sp. NPDC020983]|uniref:hypothetical protein n=1 Tax=Streptomyces sp. NPDC020983 TaxID=3365106 RepID=UPI0037A0A38F